MHPKSHLRMKKLRSIAGGDTYTIIYLKMQLLSLQNEGMLYYEGTNKAFELPEFKSVELAKNFVNMLDAEELVKDTLNSGIADDINVYIGDENENKELKDFSIITFNHKVQGKSVGTIGIIGPKRMDYSKVISVLKYINRRMNNGGLLGAGKEEEK